MLPLPRNVGGSQFGRASHGVIVPASLGVLRFRDHSTCSKVRGSSAGDVHNINSSAKH